MNSPTFPFVESVVPLFDPNWRRFKRQFERDRAAKLADYLAASPQYDPIWVLAHVQQIDELATMGMILPDPWALEIAREFARLCECDWRRGPRIEVLIHNVEGGAEWARLFQIEGRRLELSPLPWLEVGVRVEIEHEDFDSRTTVSLWGTCDGHSEQGSTIALQSPARITRSS